ncbi:MAG: DUF4153 domain-containing protein [Beutenbergiaceae bacterium]
MNQIPPLGAEGQQGPSPTISEHHLPHRYGPAYGQAHLGPVQRPPAVAPPGPIARWWSSGDRMPLGVLWWVLGVGAAAAAILVDHSAGLGLAAIALLSWLPAMWALVRARAWSRLGTAVLGVALAGVAVLRDADWLVVLCLIAALGLWAVVATNARSIAGILLAWPSLPVPVARSLRWAYDGIVTGAADTRARVITWIRTALVTVGLLLIFGLLLASADAVFASFLPDLSFGLLPERVFVGAFIALAVLTVACAAVTPPPWGQVRPPVKAASSAVAWFVPVLAVVTLMAAFLLTQVVAAAGGDDYVLRTAGLTYASYARQGFGQLVAVTALTLVVVGWFAIRMPTAPGGQQRRWDARVSLGLLCLMALGIVATAVNRMALYVGAYGLTELRLLATTGEFVMAAILVMVIIAGVRGNGRWVPLAAVQVTGVAMLALALLNPDAMIVRYNAQAQEVDLDVYHLAMLSADAVPAIDELDEPIRSCVLSQHDSTTDPSIWGWNLGRARAAAIDDVDFYPADSAGLPDGCDLWRN